MKQRPILTREARELCTHGKVVGPLDRPCHCLRCGVLFDEQTGDEDWPATETADREDTKGAHKT